MAGKPGSAVSIDDIDRKKCQPERQSAQISDIDVIIVKNVQGRILFNRMVGKFDYKEKGVKPIPADTVYPVYVTSSELITSGCRFGVWEYYTDYDELAKHVNVDNWQDDFIEFQRLLCQLLNITE